MMEGWPLTFTVDAAPVGKGRPRYGAPRKGADKQIVGVRADHNGVRLVERPIRPVVYTPRRTKNAEQVVWGTAVAARNAAGAKCIGSKFPVYVDIEAGMAIPKSWPKAAREAAAANKTIPIGVPDLDNIVKLVMDAINGSLFEDDRQVSRITARKVFATTPFVKVTVGIIEEAT